MCYVTRSGRLKLTRFSTRDLLNFERKNNVSLDGPARSSLYCLPVPVLFVAEYAVFREKGIGATRRSDPHAAVQPCSRAAVQQCSRRPLLSQLQDSSTTARESRNLQLFLCPRTNSPPLGNEPQKSPMT